mgnify:FL=1
MITQFSRTELEYGKEALDKLYKSRIAVFGIGGVGSYAAESLVRAGVKKIDLIDNDTVCLTNINRQLFAVHSTIGLDKTCAAKQRLLDINPNAEITCRNLFYNKETENEIDFSEFDYIIDAIDTVSSKILIAQNAKNANVPLISAMGAGNKLDPTAFEVTDIFKTAVCPLAKVMRTELKKRGIKKLKVVYSKELPLKPKEISEEKSAKRQIPGSNPFVPPVMGLIIASEVVKDITGIKGRGMGI